MEVGGELVREPSGVRRIGALILSRDVADAMGSVAGLAIARAMAGDAEGRIVPRFDKVSRKIIRLMDEGGVHSAVLLHAPGEFVAVVRVALHAIVLAVALRAHLGLRPSVVFVVS